MHCFLLPENRPSLLAALACAVLLLPACAGPDERVALLDELMTQYHGLGQFNGAVLVSDGGTVLLRKGYGFADFERQIANSPDTGFLVGSITKALTACAVARLVDNDTLELDATVSDYLDWYRSDTGKVLTVKHLLTHTDGLPNYTRNPEYWRPYENGAAYGTRVYIEKYASGDPEFDPGTRYEYGNSGYSVIGAIIEAATGKPYADVVAETILSPFGMSSTGTMPDDRPAENRARGYRVSFDGYRLAEPIGKPFFAAADAYSTVDDIARLLHAFNDGELVSPGMRDILLQERDGVTEGRFAYGWNVGTFTLGGGIGGQRYISTNGEVDGFNAAAIRFPDTDKTVILLNNTGEVELFAIASNILRVLHGLPATEPAPGVRDEFYRLLQTESLDSAIAYYRAQRDRNPDDYIYRRWPLRILAGQFREAGRLSEAKRVLQLNLETHPDDAQTMSELASLQ